MADVHYTTPDPRAPISEPASDSDTPDGYNLALGRQLIQAPSTDPSCAIVHVDGYCHDTGISPGDLCCVDFTDTTVKEGLYIITVDDEWIAFKRFQRTIDGRLRVIEGGSVSDVTEEATESFKVVGRVNAVYHRMPV